MYVNGKLVKLIGGSDHHDKLFLTKIYLIKCKFSFNLIYI